MRKGLAWLGCASVLVLGCGDDGVVPEDDSTSGSAETTNPGTSSGIDPSATTLPMTTSDDTSTTTDEPGSTTVVDDSSTGVDPSCGNDLVEDGELCDGTDLAGEDCVSQGFDAGELACDARCSGYDTRACYHFNCGNDVLEGKEACDGSDFGGATCQSLGYDSGTLECGLACDAIDVTACGTCGNVIVDGDEVCDDFLLLGQSCVSQGYDSGTLGCTLDCLAYDTTGCGTCGNDLVDGSEFCDGLELGGQDCTTIGMGYDSGTLACGGSCSAYDTSGCGTCGNGSVDGDEVCDLNALGGESCQSQGFDNGQLGCTPDCAALDTTGCGTCGNGVIDGSEGCDGMLLGGQTCASLGLLGGTLACSASCQLDTTACDIPGVPFGSDTGYNGYVIQGAALPCDDIVATGTPTLLTDDSRIVVPIGFTFPMYGVGFNNVTIQSNGALHFDTDTYMTLANTCLPTATAPTANNLYVFWDDLNPNVAGPSEVYYQTLGPVGSQRFVVQWETAFFGGDGMDLIRVQAMLDELTGQIDVCYVDTTSLAHARNNGAQATSGIQQSSMNGFQYSCNTPDLTAGTRLLYLPI
ncbi:MAG: hypothetical protein KDK70_04610 [Myxococcales bacterium]|nr:hypothetical protein [Myxococcales bacterium]